MSTAIARPLVPARPLAPTSTRTPRLEVVPTPARRRRPRIVYAIVALAGAVAIGAAQMLDRNDMGGMARGQQPDAGVHRLIDQPCGGQASRKHRAGAAIALGAALLGAGHPARKAQMIQQRVRSADLCQGDLGVVQKKPQLGHDSLSLPWSKSTAWRCVSKSAVI